MLRAGRLGRYSVTIQELTAVQDDAGQAIKTWTTVTAAVPCEIISAYGGETIRGRQVEARTTHVVTMHFREGITPTMRLVETANGRVLNITRADDFNGKRRELILECMADANG